MRYSQAQAILAEFPDAGNGPIQFISSDSSRTNPEDFELRPATLEDLEDDCPACNATRNQILAGNPPMILTQKPAGE